MTLRCPPTLPQKPLHKQHSQVTISRVISPSDCNCISTSPHPHMNDDPKGTQRYRRMKAVTTMIFQEKTWNVCTLLLLRIGNLNIHVVTIAHANTKAALLIPS
mmetsp:Transcript_31199/g.57701  ORF Transcript_31199/g.57701 Transcript_31199/m.57701 type:complete len:103 (+) Transcript_31199:450-758(+)